MEVEYGMAEEVGERKIRNERGEKRDYKGKVRQDI